MSELNKDIPASKPPKASARLSASLVAALRWFVVALATFGLGALLVSVIYLIPTRQKLDKATADLDQATQVIATLEAEKAGLTSQVNALTAEASLANQHIYLLQTLTSVQEASLALAENDTTAMGLSLQRASQALDSLTPLLDATYKTALSEMKQELALAQTKMTVEPQNARTHLQKLQTNLKLLEDNLFPRR